jgi:hypothetical protein
MGKFAILAILAAMLFAAPAGTVWADEEEPPTIEEVEEEIAAREAQMEHWTMKYETFLARLEAKRDWFAANGMERQAAKFQWYIDNKLEPRYARIMARLQARLEYLNELLAELQAAAEPEPEPTA